MSAVTVALSILAGLLVVMLVIIWLKPELELFGQTLQREWAALIDIKDEVIEFHRSVWEIYREVRRERVNRRDEL